MVRTAAVAATAERFVLNKLDASCPCSLPMLYIDLFMYFQGHSGQDATRYSSGTNGGRGGDGGAGGLGSDGSDGGPGGLVRATCYAGDEYLYMAVDDLVSPDHLVRGGPGGIAGRHGRGGSGGAGGRGGSSYSWTESHTV